MDLSVVSLTADGVNAARLDVPAGECVVLMGASGSGKTRLLRAIADLDPNMGTIRCGGADRRAMPAPSWRRRVAFVPAESGWWADVVGDHFEPGEESLAEITALHLPADALNWQVDHISSGERQRLALARALALAPDVLLLDEPTSALDGEARAVVEARLQRFCAGGGGILLVTHDGDQAKRLGARVFTLADGRLLDEAMA